MTHLLVRVSDAHEAAQAAASGIDAVEFLVESNAQSDLSVARAVRTAFPGVLRLRFSGGDPRADHAAAISLEAQEIAFPLDTIETQDFASASSLRPVVILSPADLATAMRRIGDRGCALMLDAGGDNRLIDTAGIAELDAFAAACRVKGLSFGLCGRLEAPDIARLLLLKPDVLAFDTAVRQSHAVDGALKTDALDALRAIVPRERREGRIDPARITKVIDRIFVRDFEVSLAIGAYQAEHGKSQRVRFSIVADVVREPRPPRDMRDVFSYDVIIETIRVLAERAHVTFVETLAEEVAASLLTHVEVVAVSVKVEKLDVIQGAVGIEILRRRETP